MIAFRYLQQIAKRYYPYRWSLTILGLTTFASIILLVRLLSKGAPLEEGTLLNAFFVTGASFGSICIAAAALAFQLDPERGELRNEKDEGWFVKTFNICMRTIVSVSMIGLVILSIWFTAQAWISIIR